MRRSLIFPEIPVSQVTVFPTYKNAQVVFYSVFFIRKSMQWTREHDILLCREVLALEVYKHTKKGTNEAGRLWDEIAKNLRGCQTVRFKSNLTQRAVRERFNLIQGRFKENKKTELAASGISVPEQDELDVLLEDIASLPLSAIAEASEKKGQEKATAEDIRNQALERMGQTKKRKSEDSQEPKERKCRRSSNEALRFMQEKAESDMALREEELKIRKKRRRNKRCSVPSNVHPTAIRLAGNGPTAGSTAATESTHADVNGTAKSGNDVCLRKTLAKRVTQKSLGFFKNRSVSLHVSFTARSVTFKRDVKSFHVL